MQPGLALADQQRLPSYLETHDDARVSPTI